MLTAGEKYKVASQRSGRKIGICSSVFVWTRTAHSNSRGPVMVGALTLCFPRMLPTAMSVQKYTRMARMVTMAVAAAIGVPVMLSLQILIRTQRLLADI